MNLSKLNVVVPGKTAYIAFSSKTLLRNSIDSSNSSATTHVMSNCNLVTIVVRIRPNVYKYVVLVGAYVRTSVGIR